MKKEIDEFLKSNQSVYGEGYTSNVPNFYNSLRQGFDFYFRTFQSKNSSYDSYTFSFNNMDSPFNLEQQKRMQEDYINRDFTDEDNFLLSIVSFQRFFELLIKNILFEIDERLVLKVNSSDILSIINPSIKADKFTQKIEAGEAISRIKKLYKRNDNGMFGDYFPDFDKVRLSYQFLVDEENISTIEQLNSWRNVSITYIILLITTIMEIYYDISTDKLHKIIDYSTLLNNIIPLPKLWTYIYFIFQPLITILIYIIKFYATATLQIQYILPQLIGTYIVNVPFMVHWLRGKKFIY
jgi:hypothetical protein